VIGVPDATWGETVIAIVVLKAGQHAPAEELQAFCRHRLAGWSSGDGPPARSPATARVRRCSTLLPTTSRNCLTRFGCLPPALSLRRSHCRAPCSPTRPPGWLRSLCSPPPSLVATFGEAEGCSAPSRLGLRRRGRWRGCSGLRRRRWGSAGCTSSACLALRRVWRAAMCTPAPSRRTGRNPGIRLPGDPTIRPAGRHSDRSRNGLCGRPAACPEGR